jgi:hypothetical protein
LKKLAQTDAIFDNVAHENQRADANPKSLRLSIDTKANVKIGNLSRHGKDRTLETRKADDHDSEWQSVLGPFGILNLDNSSLSRLRMPKGPILAASKKWTFRSSIASAI